MTTILAAGTGMQTVSTGEMIAFCVFAVLATVGALGVILLKNPVHCALSLVGLMLCLAVLYGLENATFLAVVQVLVYTGAIMMLFLFVLMLIGVDSVDTFKDVIRGQRIAGTVFGIAFFALIAFTAGHAASAMHVAGLGTANQNGNLEGIAELLFTRYVVAFELTSALLITAALGAMVLAHRERLGQRLTQRVLSEARFSGDHPTPLPGPGTFAGHNAVDTPALLPDGSVAPGSIAKVLLPIAIEHYPELAIGGEPVREEGGSVGSDADHLPSPKDVAVPPEASSDLSGPTPGQPEGTEK